MHDPLKALVDAGVIGTSTFPENSRYHAVPVTRHVTPDGEVIVHLARRFLPDPAALVPIARHRVAQGDRLDLVAARHLGDPLLFWRIADASGALAPETLTDDAGRVLTIALPEGFGGGIA